MVFAINREGVPAWLASDTLTIHVHSASTGKAKRRLNHPSQSAHGSERCPIVAPIDTSVTSAWAKARAQLDLAVGGSTHRPPAPLR